MRIGARLTGRVLDIRLVRYALASAGALAVDVGLFVALVALDMWAAAASVIGYSAGIAAHWLFSSRAVFVGQVAGGGKARNVQKALFGGSALVGLGLTFAIVAAGARAGADPLLAKLAAVAISFVATWLLRSRMIFR